MREYNQTDIDFNNMFHSFFEHKLYFLSTDRILLKAKNYEQYYSIGIKRIDNIPDDELCKENDPDKSFHITITDIRKEPVNIAQEIIKQQSKDEQDRFFERWTGRCT